MLSINYTVKLLEILGANDQSPERAIVVTTNACLLIAFSDFHTMSCIYLKHVHCNTAIVCFLSAPNACIPSPLTYTLLKSSESSGGGLSFA